MSAAERELCRVLGLRDHEQRSIDRAQKFWSKTSTDALEDGRAHWRYHGVFANDDARWLSLGVNNLELFERTAGPGWLEQHGGRIVDWGCGGGSNAIHFGRHAGRYYGVDITTSSLRECSTQMANAELRNFVPVVIDAARPELACVEIAEPVDLVLCTYVFELIPTKRYGERMLTVLRALLRDDGYAFIQIKYSDGTWRSMARRFGYERSFANMTTYRIEEFWEIAMKLGLPPQAVVLEPQQPLVDDRRYAYFLLRRAS